MDFNSNNTFFHNNFTFGSFFPVFIQGGTGNLLDNGYPSGGNWWSNNPYCQDTKQGPLQDQPGPDGIGDTPYSVQGEVCTIDCFYITVYDNYPFLQENGWEAPTLPDLSVTSVPLEFFNDEPPFLPNALKIRAWVTNNGTVTAEQPIARFFLDNNLIGAKNLDPIGPEGGTEATIEWTASVNVENAVLKVEVESIDQEDLNPPDNAITQPLSFYFVDFRHDRDAFSFQNWRYEGFNDFRGELIEFLKTQLKEKRYAVFATTISTPWLFGLFYKDGHCYGMATVSTLWKVFPEIKPLPKETYQMTLEEARPDILFYHWQMPLYLLYEGLWELPPSLYNASDEYSELLESIKNNEKPMVVGLSNWPPSQGHAVTGYSILDLQDKKQVFMYDNILPLELLESIGRRIAYATFKLSSNEAVYEDAHNRVLAVPLEIVREDMVRIISQLIHQKIGDWWNRGLMLFRNRSPVDPLLIDGFGRRIGYVEGIFVNEIPGAEMEQQDDSDLFYLPSDLTYSIEMTGTDTGTLGLDFVIPASEFRAKVVIYEGIPVTLGSIVTTTLSVAGVPDEVVLDSGEAIIPTAAGELDASDIVPPASVNDLTATDPKTNSIALNWTAPGNDWATGTAATYDIRYSTSPITEENWEMATRVTNETTPQPAGSREAITVSGLDSNATYHFALKTADEIPNWSSLSNIATGTTKIEASVDIDPDTLNLKSKSKWVTGYIELPQRYDVGQIDISTVKLNDMVSAEADPKYGFVKNPEVKDRDKNGLPELMVKFDHQKVQGILNFGKEIAVTITGRVFHNQHYKEFEGSAIIRVINKGKSD